MSTAICPVKSKKPVCMKMDIKFNFNSICGLFNKKFLSFISLFFMVVFVSSTLIPEVNGQLFCGNMFHIYVETEVELVNAIDTAPDGSMYVIVLSNDIKLEESLVIPKGKIIGLVSSCLFGADGMDVIVVKSGGELSLWNRIVVTHVEGDSGRGVYVERGGVCNLNTCEISGNTAECGGGVYNEGAVNLNANSDGGGSISNNTATSGGGVYNVGVFVMSGGVISGNNASIEGGGVYNSKEATFEMSGGEITKNTAGIGGGIYYFSGSVSGTFTLSGGEIFGNKAMSFSNVCEVAVDGRSYFGIYLLFIVVAAVVAVVVGLLFYHLKMRKQQVVKGLVGSVSNVECCNCLVKVGVWLYECESVC